MPWPQWMMEIVPAQAQMSLQSWHKAGNCFSNNFCSPFSQGAVVLGMHGIGCKRPKLAAVAAATVGLAKERHNPKGSMFAIGLKSEMLACGCPSSSILRSGKTTSVEGVVPIVHFIFAPLQTYTLPILTDSNHFCVNIHAVSAVNLQ